MKVLCISFSPRKRDNTEILLDEVMKGAQECGTVVVGGNLGHFSVWALFNALFTEVRMFTTDMVQGFAEGKGAIRKDELAMKDALQLGKIMVSLIKQKLESPFDNRRIVDGVLIKTKVAIAEKHARWITDGGDT